MTTKLPLDPLVLPGEPLTAEQIALSGLDFKTRNAIRRVVQSSQVLVQFADVASLNAAIAANPGWVSGQLLQVLTDPPGVYWTWNGVAAVAPYYSSFPINPLAYAGDAKAWLKWEAPTYNVPTHYKIYGGPSTITIDASTLSAGLEYTITGLTNGQSYSFTITAVHNGTESAIASFNAVTPSSRTAGLNIKGLIQYINPALWSGISNGQAVTNPADSSGLGQNWIAASNQPTFTASAINSLPALTFNGSSKWADTGIYVSNKPIGGKPQLRTQHTIIMVFQPAAVNLAPQKLLSNQSSSPASNYLDIGWDINNADFRVKKWDGNLVSNPASAFSADTPYILSIVKPGRSYINGTKGTATVLQADFEQPKGTLLAGARHNTIGSSRANFFNGYIARVILFDRVLTDAERWTIEAELAAEFNITVVQQ